MGRAYSGFESALPEMFVSRLRIAACQIRVREHCPQLTIEYLLGWHIAGDDMVTYGHEGWRSIGPSRPVSRTFC